jgi:hypothetical protein
MSRALRCCIAFVAVLSVMVATAPRCSAATPDQINDAISKAQQYLLSQQKAGGRWEPDAARVGDAHDWATLQGDSWGGYTAMATYALLASGVSTNDPHIVQAVDFLKKADIIGIYAIGVRLQVWLLMWQNSAPAARGEFVNLATADANRLLKGVHDEGVAEALWTYLPTWALPAEGGARIDHSVSQYGILGLWAAEQMGVEIPVRAWAAFDARWRADQFPDGGWSYSASPKVQGNPVSASMTAAGIASLFITQQSTQGNKMVACNGNILNLNIDHGLAWMTRNYAQVNDLYTFYGIERIGVASGYKYFGTTDWFADIADRLVKAQNPPGNWGGNGLSAFPGESPIPATAYGLLFLSRGGAPVMMNKLDYSLKHEQANWNERPRDIYNLAQWSGEQSEADLNFQVVNLGVSVRDLHDSAILYIAGNQLLKLSDADIAKLHEFITEGGLILGNADCNSLAFKNSFTSLAQKMFPQYPIRPLPKDNIIFKEANTKFRGNPQLMGVSNGVREMMLLLPTGDPSRAWQTKAFAQSLDDFKLGFNIFLYAVDTKGLRNKGVYYLIDPDPAVHPTDSIKVARLMVGDNPNPEPGGWPRLTALLHNAPYKLDVQVTAIKPGDPLAGYKIVDLTGTTAFKLNDAERADLLEFTKHGGTIIIDAAGGSGEFANSAENELAAIFGKEPTTAGLARPLPMKSAVYHLPNADITAVSYRHFARNLIVGRPTVPQIRGIEVKKRIVAFYSREDLSAGLVGEAVDGIDGYSPESATDLMRNLVLFCTDRPKAAPPTTSTKPATKPG